MIKWLKKDEIIIPMLIALGIISLWVITIIAIGSPIIKIAQVKHELRIATQSMVTTAGIAIRPNTAQVEALENRDELYCFNDNIVSYMALYEPHEPTQEIQYFAADETILVSLGYFEITFYCVCISCTGIWSEQHPSRIGTDYIQRTASGTIPEAGRTISVDPDVIPLGAEVYINGLGWRIAEDTGSLVTGNIIDAFVGSHETAHEEALQLGRQRDVEVFVEGD